MIGWLGRGLGQFGSDVAAGRDIAQQRTFDIAKQRLDTLKGQLDLQTLQKQLAQMGQPQPAGVQKLPSGGLGGVTFDPTTGTYSIQTLAPGAPPEPKFSSLQQAAAYYLQKGDYEKLKTVNDEIDRTKTAQKPAEIKDPFELWRSQNANAPVADYFKLQEQYKKPAGEGGIKTPFELWRQNHPKGTYEEWLGASKQEDRTDATRAVTTVLNAQKSLQSLEAGIQKSNKTFSVWNPKTWGTDPALTALTQQAVDDYQAKKQDAVEKLTDAGMPIPAWLNSSGGGGSTVPPPNVPPPPGFVPNKGS